MGEQTYGPGGTRLARLNTVGAGTYVVHTGRITEINRKNRQVDITSRNLMSQVEDLEWRFPVRQSGFSWDALYGSSFFFYGLDLSSPSNFLVPAFFNTNDTGDAFDAYAFVGSNVSVTSAYPAPSGRGQLGTNSSNGFVYPGTQFYYDYSRLLFKGTYLEYTTTNITTDEQAQSYGFVNLAAANAALVSGTYALDRTKLVLQGPLPTSLTGSYLYMQQVLTLGATPAKLWQEMLTGCCVTPLFGSSTIDGNTFATAQINTAFQFHEQTIDPKGGKVLPYLKNLLEPLRALWSVSSANTFRLYTFGPKTFADVIGTIGMSEIMESSVSSNIEDKINRVSLDYGYVFTTGSYSKRLETKGSNWGSSNDFPFEVKSQWISNANDAALVAQKIVRRFTRGQPKLQLTLPFTRLTADVGSLFAVTDDDMSYSGKVFEVVGWRKDFSSDRKMTIDLWDGDALYAQRGYAKYEDGTLGDEVVSGTSLSGYSGSGTVHNINQAYYGSVFVYS
jgi:hypothetical protein